jgi:hypothetical protein
MDNTFHVYRVFRLHAREVWSCPLPETVAVALQESDFETLKYMFSEVPPYVFTKRATPFLASQFLTWWKTYVSPEHHILQHRILSIIEAYPASYHHAPTQEIGIGFGLDNSHWLKWPNWRWNTVTEYGQVTHSCLSEAELRSRKKNCNGRPRGVPDELWRGL